MAEDKMVRWYHRFNGHEFEQALGVGDEPGSLACCSPWGGHLLLSPSSPALSLSQNQGLF